MPILKTPDSPKKITKGDRTRLSILNEAETIFAELGYAAARLEDVAVAVAIHRASLIYYYRNKQDLFDAVEARIFNDLQNEVENRLKDQTTAYGRILAIFDCWLDFMSERTTAARMVLRSSADVTPRNSNPVEFSGSTVELFESIVKEGIDNGEFPPVDPLDLLNGAGGGIIYYACNARAFGASRAYSPADPATREKFRKSLHKVVRALLSDDDA